MKSVQQGRQIHTVPKPGASIMSSIMFLVKYSPKYRAVTVIVTFKEHVLDVIRRPTSQHKCKNMILPFPIFKGGRNLEPDAK